jgi:hypothetical protein
MVKVITSFSRDGSSGGGVISAVDSGAFPGPHPVGRVNKTATSAGMAAHAPVAGRNFSSAPPHEAAGPSGSDLESNMGQHVTKLRAAHNKNLRFHRGIQPAKQNCMANWRNPLLQPRNPEPNATPHTHHMRPSRIAWQKIFFEIFSGKPLTSSPRRDNFLLQ